MSGGGNDIAALQADVERSRDELAATIDELTARLDKRPSPTVLAAGAGIAAAIVTLVVVLRRRRR